MKFCISLLLTVLLCVPVSSVAQATAPLTPDEKKAKLQDAAVSFLLETYSDIGNMRLVENRISFTSELAALLWYKDQKSAAAMFGSAINDFKQLLTVYDGQMNAFGLKSEDEDPMASVPFFGEPTDRGQVEKKFRNALGVRQQIAMSIAEHEPELAYNFFYDSVSAVTNPEFRKQMESNDSNYEQQLLTRIASVDVKKAAELSKRSLSKGVTGRHVDLLRKLYVKDADAATDYAEELLSRLKSTSPEKLEKHSVRSLLSLADGTMKPGNDGKKRKPVFSNSQLIELAEILAKGIMETAAADDPMPDISLVEKYVPGRAAQIKAKFNSQNSSPNKFTAIGGPPPPMASPADYKGSVNTIGVLSDKNPDAAATVRAAKQENERKAMEDIKKLDQKDLPKEEREKIIGIARQLLSESKSKSAKIAGLSGLAAYVAKSGDKELAVEIMEEASSFVNSQPKNYQDVMNTWVFATGYILVDPDKAFRIFDDMIYKTNDLVSAVVKIAEFMDAKEEIIADGEFQVGAFGGQMIQALLEARVSQIRHLRL